ncbi:threonine/serine exporter family protein [Bacillus sp. SM2101]|uniref:threonine/serine exporter family protein n=1 Tax=Bacillus sp. SM2101 TaxID=2805366 RepID=UPI001BDE437B|nr:threonine/serine exporter family protein [Bacillus sp. SM2101]
MIIEQLVTSFVAAAAFGIMFNVPRKSLIKCGFVGMLGWIIYVLLTGNDIDSVFSTVVASFVVAVMSQIFSRMYKTPIIVFIVSGIIPLVPGGLAYDAMRNFVQNDYNTAINLAAKAFMISGAIAIGLVFSEVINQVIRKSKLTLNRSGYSK